MGRDPRSWTHLFALVVGLATVTAALVLPIAPVWRSEPVVQWPTNVQQPESTTLILAAYRPLSLQLDASCDVVRLADATNGGVVLSTLRSNDPAAATRGLVVEAVAGRVTVRLSGEVLVGEPIPDGDCQYKISSDADGARVLRDGVVIGSRTGDLLPDVEVLATDITDIPNADQTDLRLRLDVNDEFASSPSWPKVGVMAAIVVGSLISLTLLRRWDRQAPRPARGPPRRYDLLVWDLAVVGALVAWVVLAPPTDDDGYYSAMSRNVGASGYVGSYFQMFNHSFVPLTWVWYALSVWQQVGVSPVILRIPAFLAGFLTWLVVRRFVRGSGIGTSRWGAHALLGLLGAGFLAWWLPYNMGVRPETVVALLSGATLLSVAVGIERRRLFPIAVGGVLAGLSFAAHPTGAVALAVLLAALSRLWSVIRIPGSWLATAGRLAAVGSPAALTSLAAFADGSLHEYRRGREVFLAIETPNNWENEYGRWGLLLNPAIPMGAYAKRAAVLVALVLLAYFVVSTIASRAAGFATVPRLDLTGWSLLLAFVSLWITPSKWTHHFGSLAALGAAFIALFAFLLPRIVAQLRPARRRSTAGALLLMAPLVIVMDLALSGPNLWPYTWPLGMPHADVAPYVTPGFELGSSVLWAGIALLCLLAMLPLRPRLPAEGSVAAIPLLVVVFFGATVGYLFVTFGVAAARFDQTWSLGGSNLRDPLATECSLAGAIDVFDERNGRPLPAIVPASEPSVGFAEGTGWWEVTPPPLPDGTVTVWGSRAPDSAPTGDVVTPWYELPDTVDARQMVVVLAAGQLGDGNVLEVEFGRQRGAEVALVASQLLDDEQAAHWWRSLVAVDGRSPGPARGADVVRLRAADGTRVGWLAFSAPIVTTATPMPDYLAGSPTVAYTWQTAMQFPCEGQVEIRDGIAQPPDYAVTWSSPPFAGISGEPSWQEGRGGLFAPLKTASTIVTTTARFRDDPELPWGQLHRLEYGIADDAYGVIEGRSQVSGLDGSPV